MRRLFKNLTIVLFLLVSFALADYVFAADEQAVQVVQELTSGLGLPEETTGYLAEGPGDGLGQRLQDMLHNGAINQHQYNTIMNRFSALPDEKRWAIKGAYDRGKDVSNIMHTVQGTGQQEDASLREHIKELKEQGLSKEQIAERLHNEGVAPDHIKDLGFTPPQAEGSLRDHLKDAGVPHDKIKDKRDKREDVRDHKEDILDRRENVRDKREDVWDKREDIRDKKEDIRDAQHDGGRRDKLEDIRDRREDVRDRKEDVGDRRENIRDRREDVRDHKENRLDKQENVRDGKHPLSSGQHLPKRQNTGGGGGR